MTFLRHRHDLTIHVPHREKRMLRENQVITIEPFLSTGAREVFDIGDGWTLATAKEFFTAQYEHTLVITKGRPLIMTLPTV